MSPGKPSSPVLLFLVNPCHEVLLANNSVVHLTTYCLIGQVVICQEGLQPDIAFFLVTLQFHVNQRSKDLRLKDLGPVDLKCDNQVVIYIAVNLVFHTRTKYIEVDCHYVLDQVKSDLVPPSHVPLKTQ
ncbi:hypothetical protein Tco_0105895 [Tanacetum coccineum]